MATFLSANLATVTGLVRAVIPVFRDAQPLWSLTNELSVVSTHRLRIARLLLLHLQRNSKMFRTAIVPHLKSMMTKRTILSHLFLPAQLPEALDKSLYSLLFYFFTYLSFFLKNKKKSFFFILNNRLRL